MPFVNLINTKFNWTVDVNWFRLSFRIYVSIISSSDTESNLFFFISMGKLFHWHISCVTSNKRDSVDVKDKEDIKIHRMSSHGRLELFLFKNSKESRKKREQKELGKITKQCVCAKEAAVWKSEPTMTLVARQQP